MVVYQVSSERMYTAEAYILPSSINSFLFAIVTVIVLSLSLVESSGVLAL